MQPRPLTARPGTVARTIWGKAHPRTPRPLCTEAGAGPQTSLLEPLQAPAQTFPTLPSGFPEFCPLFLKSALISTPLPPPTHTQTPQLSAVSWKGHRLPEDLGSDATAIKWVLPVPALQPQANHLTSLCLEVPTCTKGETLLAPPTRWACSKGDRSEAHYQW